MKYDYIHTQQLYTVTEAHQLHCLGTCSKVFHQPLPGTELSCSRAYGVGDNAKCFLISCSALGGVQFAGYDAADAAAFVAVQWLLLLPCSSVVAPVACAAGYKIDSSSILSDNAHLKCFIAALLDTNTCAK